MSTYSYKDIHVHFTHMNKFKGLNQLDLEINEIGHQERLVINGDVASH
jgi:hypothetical protein